MIDDGMLRVGDEVVDLAAHNRVLVFGGGNAVGRVAAALYECLGDRIDDGIIVTDDPASAGPIEMRERTHPLPSQPNVAGTRKLLEYACATDEDTLALVPVTGGGSALLTAPSGEIELDDMVALTESLLRSGAPISTINTVRRAVSDVEGGKLAEKLAPATTVGLVFSDVTSDDPAVVASGPLSPTPTTTADALNVLEEYNGSVESLDSVGIGR